MKLLKYSPVTPSSHNGTSLHAHAPLPALPPSLPPSFPPSTDLIMCMKQPGIAIGRLCEKCDGEEGGEGGRCWCGVAADKCEGWPLPWERVVGGGGGRRCWCGVVAEKYEG